MNSMLLNKNIIPAGNSKSKKQLQLKYRLLQHLYAAGPASTAVLCSTLGISTPTVLKILSELIHEQLIEKKGLGNSVGGRRPDLYGLKRNSFYILCIDIELFTTRITIMDNNHDMITPVTSISLSLSKNRHAYFESLKPSVDKMLQSGAIDPDRLIGASIGMPGLINPETGENFSYLLDESGNTSLRQSFEDLLQLPAVVQNDVKGTALAELRHGLARGKRNVLVLLMDWGVGLGIIMDGKVRQGSMGFSGEMGHIPFVDNGDLCYCGKHGCLETVASGITLSRMAKQDILSGKNSILHELSNKEISRIETELIIKAANKGDQYAIQLLSNIGINMGKGISILIQLFNPELIILSGKIAEAQQYITLPMQQAINTYCMTQIREKVQIASSELGNNCRLLGYASEGIDQFFAALVRSTARR